MNNNFDRSMLHSPVRNYVIPGLTSWLVGSPSPLGTVRFFECSRNHQEPITPHSHRFDFRCLVLSGRVTNRTWKPAPAAEGDAYCSTRLAYQDAIGHYNTEHIGIDFYRHQDRVYETGDWYGMAADEIHSIMFAKGTQVLFFEGPQVTNESFILEPHVHGETIPTFKVEPWMFRREA